MPVITVVIKTVFVSRLWVEKVGELKAVCGQWLSWQVQSLAWRWSWNSWEREEGKPANQWALCSKEKIQDNWRLSITWGTTDGWEGHGSSHL